MNNHPDGVGSAIAQLLTRSTRGPVELTPAAAQRLACDATTSHTDDGNGGRTDDGNDGRTDGWGAPILPDCGSSKILFWKEG